MRLSELEKKIFVLADELIQKHHVLDVHSLALHAARSLGENANPASISQAIHSLISKKLFFEGEGLTRETVLANETRKHMFDLICKHPGIHLSAIKEITGKDAKTVVIYLRILDRFGLIRFRMIDGKKAYFEMQESKDLDYIRHYLQDIKMVEILKAILENPGSSSDEIEEFLHGSLSMQLLARKIQILMERGILAGKLKSNRLISLKIKPLYVELVKKSLYS